MKQLFSLLFLLINIGHVTAQNRVQFKNIGVKDGLSATHINQIIQDKQQFIWIATANGLNRFDGIDVKVFKNQADNPHSISGDNIRCLLEDSKGDIWVGTLNSGLNRYDYKTGKFKHYLSDFEDESTISNNEILSIFEDSKGRLWVGTENGLNLFDYKTETFSRFLPNPEDKNAISAGAILSIAEDVRGWIWAGTWMGGLNLAIPTTDEKKFKFKTIYSSDKIHSLKGSHVWRLFLDKDKQLWCGTYGGGLSLMLPDSETDPNKFEPKFITFSVNQPEKPIISNSIFGLNQDDDGNLWIATIDGISLVKPHSRTNDTIELQQIGHFRNDFMNNRSLVNNEVRDIYVDKNGLVWCSTLGGISKYDKNNAYFKHLFPIDNDGQNILVFSLFSYSNDLVYIASRAEYGLMEYNQKNDTYKTYNLTTSEGIRLAPISFYQTAKNEIWIGTQLGIGRFNPITKSFKHYELKYANGKLVNTYVKKIYQDDKGQLWFATALGVVVFRPDKEKFEFIDEDSNGTEFKRLDTNDLLFKDKTLWLATYGGLARIDFQNDGEFIFKIYKNITNDQKSIPSNRVISLTEVDGKIWVGTENGLCRYEESTDNFSIFNAGNGLKNPNIIALLSNDDNHLWLATRSGLGVMDTKTEKFIHYDEKDGIRLGAFTQNSVALDDKNQLYFGGTNGFIRFDAKEIKPNTYVPPIRITGFKVFNKDLELDEDIAIAKKIVLQPDQNYFTIDFAALNYTQSSDNIYAYKLEGFNNDWMECGTQKSVSFSNLNGGTYTFRVKATNNDGVWNEAGTTLQITIIPSVWQRNWFKALIAFLICGLPLLIYFYRLNLIQSQKDKLEEQVKIRTEEIQLQNLQIEGLVEELKLQNSQLEEIVQQRTETLERSNLELKRSNKDLEQFAYVASHDLQEPLRTIGSFTQLLQRRYKDKIDAEGQMFINQAVSGVKRMSALIKSLLNYSRLGRSDIEFLPQNPLDIVKQKIADLDLKIQEKNAEIIITDLPKSVICEPNQLGIVFYNLINNGIKFNRQATPKIIIKLHQEDENYFTFAVSDNGIGIKENYKAKVFEIFKRLHSSAEFEGNGIGLAFCKRIINRHEGTIWFESEIGKGTTFYFTIHKHLSNISYLNTNKEQFVQ